MKDYLTFQLSGLMSSWGNVTVGEVRPSLDHPTRSALLGLLASALGIKRDEYDKHKQLSRQCLFAIKALSLGRPLNDYHTVQTVSQNKKRRYMTRKEALKTEGDPETLLTYRDYYCDQLFCVAVELVDNPSWSLDVIRVALKQPVFHLYLGRKSCPLSLPLKAVIGQYDSVKSALDAVDTDKKCEKNTCIYYWESGQLGFDADESISVLQRDQPFNRKRWQFDERLEYQTTNKG